VLAAILLINYGAVYAGILYVLVYVGAIVVLILFVVQLTDTGLSINYGNSNKNIAINLVLITSILFIILYNLTYGDTDNHVIEILINISNLDLNNQMVSNLTNTNAYNNNLSLLATSLFNEYAYILVISVHAIILAIIGPIKLALADLS
jgi:NADH:ubiquinone oxidoreductase subunit 6 (subunit J)